MSRKGNCLGNACVESFFDSLKNKWIGDKIYEGLEAGKRDVFKIKVFYDRQRSMHHWVM